MGKKDKANKSQRVDENGVIQVDPPKSVGNQEHFQRINYLYQLSTWQTMVMNVHDKNQGMARMYVKNMDLVSKRTKSSLLPQLKRTCCKKCHRVLIPKRNVETRITQGSHGDVYEWKCKCGQIKNFPIGLNRDYKTFYEKPGNVIGIQMKSCF